jgi:signal peptidase I
MPGPIKRPKTRLHNAIELVLTIVVAIGLALGIQAFLVKPYRIPSGSMIPTLVVGQRILVNRLDTHPSLYNVVVFHPPAGADPTPAVCGDPGQGVNYTRNADDPQPCDKPTPAESTQTFVKRVVGLPGDHLLIKGGRVWRNGVEEKASYIQPCPNGIDCTWTQTITVPAGHYYMMGDNRDVSDDSRFWGPVPQKWIIGVAFATYWPLSRIGTL